MTTAQSPQPTPLWLSNARALHPDTSHGDTLTRVEILIVDGVIAAIGWGDEGVRAITTHPKAASAHQVDLQGALLTPGLIDVHIHLREPGQEAKETIATGTRAAARGGWTTVCAMPNTVPDPHTPELLQALQERINRDAVIRVRPIAPITPGLHGDQVVAMDALVAAGAVAFSNDGYGVQQAGTMLRAMVQAAALGVPIATHSEDESIKGDGVINAGPAAEKFALPGIDRLAEIVQVARDIQIAAATGAHLHLCHASTREAIELARRAQADGVAVTVEATPHHLLLHEDQIPADDATWKMNPPLRADADAHALVQGLNNGTVTVIGTDNAPHLESEKHCSFRDGAFGIVSNEYAFALLYTRLVRTGRVSLRRLVTALTQGPAQAFNLDGGILAVGAPADIAVFDLARTVRIDPATFVGKAKNCPFAGADVFADCVLTIVGGHIVHDASITGS